MFFFSSIFYYKLLHYFFAKMVPTSVINFLLTTKSQIFSGPTTPLNTLLNHRTRGSNPFNYLKENCGLFFTGVWFKISEIVLVKRYFVGIGKKGVDLFHLRSQVFVINHFRFGICKIFIAEILKLKVRSASMWSNILSKLSCLVYIIQCLTP